MHFLHLNFRHIAWVPLLYYVNVSSVIYDPNPHINRMVNVIYYCAKQICFWLLISICRKCKSRCIFCWNHFADLFLKMLLIVPVKGSGMFTPFIWYFYNPFYFSGYINTYEYKNITYHALSALNSSSPSAAYMRLWTQSALFQIMACRLYSAKTLSEPILTYYQLDPEDHISSFKKLCFSMSSAKRWSFCAGGDDLIPP